MNKAILMGRLTRDPETKYSQNSSEPLAITRYSLAVDRRFSRNKSEDTADFINIVAFGKAGEFAEKYFRKGMRVAVVGRIQTGSYTNKDGVKVYTTEVIAEEQEFCESKNSQSGGGDYRPSAPMSESGVDDGFMNIPDGIEEELPFN